MAGENQGNVVSLGGVPGLSAVTVTHGLGGPGPAPPPPPPLHVAPAGNADEREAEWQNLRIKGRKRERALSARRAAQVLEMLRADDAVREAMAGYASEQAAEEQREREARALRGAVVDLGTSQTKADRVVVALGDAALVCAPADGLLEQGEDCLTIEGDEGERTIVLGVASSIGELPRLVLRGEPIGRTRRSAR